MNTNLQSKITIGALTNAYVKHGYAMFGGDAKNYNMNMFGVRCAALDTDTFNDIIGLAWKFQGEWNLRTFAVTTDPGLYYFYNPMSSKGTHIMVEGQYKGAYAIGRHQGKYEALVQVGPVDFYVDNDRDKMFDKGTIVRGQYIGANIHTTINKNVPSLSTAPETDFPNRESAVVHNWSAACQVLANPHEYRHFMELMYESSKVFGNKFTYTLFKEEDF